MKCICYILFAFFFTTATLDSQNVDSLEKVLRSDIPLDQKEDVLFKIADYHNWERPEVASNYLDTLDFLWSKRQNPRDSILFYKIQLRRALANRAIGNYTEAIKQYETIKDFFIRDGKNPKSLASATKQLAALYQYTGNYTESQENLDLTRDIYRDHGSPLDIAGIYNVYAGLMLDLDQTDKAFDYYKQALKIYEEENNNTGMENIHCNMGLSYIYQDSFEQANYHLGEYKKLLDANNGIPYSYGFYYDFMGYLHLQQKNYKEALANIQKAIEIRENLHSTYNLAESKLSLADVYIKMKKYKEAIPEVQYVLDNQKFNNSLYQQSYSHELLASAYENLHDYHQAFEHQKKHSELNDSILNNEKLEIIAEKDAKFQKSEDEKKIALLQIEKEKNSLKINSQRKITYGSLLGLLLLAIFTLSIRRKNKQIGDQNRIINRALQEKDVLLREIHHRVKNNLQLVSSLLGLQSRYVEDPKALQALKAGKSRIRSMALIHQDLYNRENIKGISAKDYIARLIKELIISFDIDSHNIKIKQEVTDKIFDVDTLIPLGLIINELLTNSVKYAFQSREKGEISIQLIEKDNKLHLTIQDDGIGFDPEEISKKSFGYRLIDALLLQLNGVVNKTTDKGTMVHIVISDYKLSEA